MAISKINNVNIAAPNSVSSATYTPQSLTQFYNFQDRFKFVEQKLESVIPDSNLETDRLKEMLQQITNEILSYNCDIISRGILTDKKYIISASFHPPLMPAKSSIIFVPTRGVSFSLSANSYQTARTFMKRNVVGVVSQIAVNSSNKDLIKLIILLSHEYGHLLSYTRGYHDKQLKLGLMFMNTKTNARGIDRYTYQVFNEEVTAWRIAWQFLKKIGFNYWEIAEAVQYDSLNAYYKILRLSTAGVGIYSQLTMLGIDLSRVIKPN